MAADFDKPTLDDTFVNVLTDIRENDKANALMFAGITVANIPVSAIQFAGGVFGTWNGASFDVTPVVIGGGGTGATTAAGARTNLSLSSVAEANALYMKVLSNGSDINDVSIFRTNIDVPSNAEALLVANDLSDINDEVTAFNNIKQGATTIFSGTVIEATPAQMRAGTGNRFPDAATIVADRTPQSIWTGSDTVVTDSEIFVNTSFTVVAGVYFIKTASETFTVSVEDIAADTFGTSKVTSPATVLTVMSAQRNSSLDFTVAEYKTGSSAASQTLVEILYIPL